MSMTEGSGAERVVWKQVTNENKREYVDLVAEHRMTTAIRAQIQAFLKGYWEMVPKVPLTPPYHHANAGNITHQIIRPFVLSVAAEELQ